MKFIYRFCAVVMVYVTTIVVLVLKIQDKYDTADTLEPRECVTRIPAPKHQVGELGNHKVTQHVERVVKSRWEVRQFGPGITGGPVTMNESDLTPEDKVTYAEHFKEDDFNGYLSDIISLYRVIEDIRPDMCRELKYPDNLPQVGVVIPFRNEHLSILLRTVYSILINTPDHLLTEIILIDDGSDHNELKSKLNIHVANLPKVKLVRLETSVGLMMARQTGIEMVTAEFFICMDCHMEMNPGWVEPLLYRLLEEPKALLCSNMGAIDRHTFRIDHCKFPDCQNYFPALLYNLDTTTFAYNKKFKTDRANATDPLPFGIIQGMMIVMSKSWFKQLGGFDPGMKIWGSEQMELSIKVWTCGGRVEMIPCSYVAHMYRRNVWMMKDEGVANLLRVAEVWMDEHKQRVHDYYKHRRLTINIGDVSERKRIRQENKCKPFQTYLDTMKQFGDFEFTEVRLKGSLKSVKTRKCMDATPQKKGPIQYWCHGETFQYFEWMESGRVRFLEHCLLPGDNNTLVLKFCIWEVPDITEAIWQYSEAGTMIHVKTKRCVTAADDGNMILLQTCTGDTNQQWEWEML